MSASKPTILLVEDEPAQRAVLAYNLKSEGFEVIEAEDGEAARNKAFHDQIKN